MLLSEPFNYVDLHHGEKAIFIVDRIEVGEGDIHPTKITQRHIRIHMDQYGLTAPPTPGTPITNRVKVLRLFGTRIDHPSNAPYWDVSSKRLWSDLETRFAAIGQFPVTITLTANGAAPSKLYSVEVG